jgi:hypothetical protein
MKPFSTRRNSTWIIVAVALPLLLFAATAELHAALLYFNSADPGDNATMRTNWLTAAGISSPAYRIDFETGFTSGQNVSGSTGLFPAGLVISSSDGSAVITSGQGSIGGSNPVGTFALAHLDEAVLTLNFSAFPVNYVALQDIDTQGTTVKVTFVGGSTVSFAIETTGSSGDSAEFLGIFRNDMPGITMVELDATGTEYWGVDNIEYGPAVPIPGAVWLLGTGLLALVGLRRRFKK